MFQGHLLETLSCEARHDYPILDVLLEQKLHDDACWVLENIGLKFKLDQNDKIRSPRLREILESLSAEDGTYIIEPEKGEGRAYFFSPLIDTAISVAPKIDDFIAQYGVPRHSFGGGQRASYVRKDGQDIEPTYEDIAAFAKLAERNNVPFMFCPVWTNFVTREESRGQPKETRRLLAIEKNEIEPLRIMAAHYSGLHFWKVTSPHAREFVKEYQNKQMGKVITNHSSILSPLTIEDSGSLDSMFDCLEDGLAVYDTSMVLGGRTAPAAMYPLAVQAHAEGLAGFVLAQVWKPGSMYVNGAYPAISSPSIMGVCVLDHLPRP